MQNEISRLCADNGASVGDFISCVQQLPGLSEQIPHYVRKSRIAFLSSYTIQGLSETMRARALFHNLWLDMYLAPYNQFTPKILNTESDFYKFGPDLVYLMIDTKDLLNESHLVELMEILDKNSNANIVIFNFIDDSGDKSRDFNKALEDLEKLHKHLTVFDFRTFLDRLGKENYWYTKYAELGDLRLAPEAFPFLAEQLLGYVVAVSGNTKKCLVVDLDNTLWQGIVGEDGIEGIVPDKDLQKYILDLQSKGVILAINSKNNEQDALEAINNHPEMILQKDHFVAWRINWQDKGQNMRELADELNIGLDSLVFLDDSSFEQDLIRSYFPEIAVISPHCLKDYSGFYKFSITKEDIRRNEMYKEERKRQELKASFNNFDDYLGNLRLEIMIEEPTPETIPRINQLTQKTNQFNLTTRRYNEEDIKSFIEKGEKIWTLKVSDKFGDYGITGVIIVKNTETCWEIDTFLLSCRILGKRIEEQFFGYALNELKMANNPPRIIGKYIPTSKNSQVKDFYEKQGFKKNTFSDGEEVWELSLENYKFENLDFIKIKKN